MRYEKQALPLLVGVLIASAVATSRAQKTPCTVVVSATKMLMASPLQPMTPGGKYYPAPLIIPERRLGPGDFVARDGLFHKVPIVLVEPDEGPRRIILVETSFAEDWRKMAGGRQAPPPDLAAVLSVARPQDRFALLAVGGPRVEVRFGSGPAALQSGLEAIAHPDANGPGGPDLFDGLMEATKWFGPPQVGDSIFQFGSIHRWRWSKAKASKLRSALIGRGIRLFSLGGAYEMFGAGLSDPLSGVQDSPLASLCDATGGGWQTIGYLGSDAYNDMSWEWQNAAKAMYEVATFDYIIHLPRTGPRIKIQITSTSGLPGSPILSYPRPMPVCP